MSYTALSKKFRKMKKQPKNTAAGQEEKDAHALAGEPLTAGELKNINRLLARLDNSGLEEFVRLSQRTWKIMWLNFLSGIAKGLGFTVGTAVVLAIAYKVLSRIVSMNIPYLTEMLKDLVELVKNVQ